MDARQYKRRVKARRARRKALSGGFARQRLEAAAQIGKHLVGHSCAHTAGIDQLAVIRVSLPAEQLTHVLLSAFAFRHSPRLSGAEGRVDCLRNRTIESKLPGVLEDEFTVTGLAAVEL
jgi:hypothetical protein